MPSSRILPNCCKHVLQLRVRPDILSLSAMNQCCAISKLTLHITVAQSSRTHTHWSTQTSATKAKLCVLSHSDLPCALSRRERDMCCAIAAGTGSHVCHNAQFVRRALGCTRPDTPLPSSLGQPGPACQPIACIQKVLESGCVVSRSYRTANYLAASEPQCRP